MGAVISVILLMMGGQIIFHNLSAPGEDIEQLIQPSYQLGSEQFLRECNSLFGSPIISGETITVLNNGEEIFPAMLKAIDGAERSVCFETFIYWSGNVGMKFSQALAAKAREGVPVHVMVDWLGSTILDGEERKLMEEAGVTFQIYRPMSWYHLQKMNHRTHRKILVVDGETAFTGGVGIADEWDGDGDSENEWRDVHFRVTGPVVAQLQATFVANWVKASGQLLHGEDYFPMIEDKGDIPMQCFRSSPSEGAENVRLMFLLLIESAQASLDIAAAYFVPDPLVTKALVAARKRGVKIRVIVPGKNNDVEAVKHASRALWGDLLREGVEIYRFGPTMYHCKAIIADRSVVTVGSANFDSRSFQLNDEMNLNIYEKGFAEQMTDVFEKDLISASQYKLEDWEGRSVVTKMQEWFYLRFRKQL